MSSTASGFRSLSIPHKLVYSSAVINITVVSLAWLKRQIKTAESEKKEVEDAESVLAEMDTGTWSETNRFRCFFAAQRYRMFGSQGPEDEQSAEIQKMLSVIKQCREDLYDLIPPETPAMTSRR
mmetsp:Transcript_16300/g.35705  ORF Transcript_16300/g.35705 Transcript_16300/m.35705 type:complete len:124 (-) Transcript_16300:65-436(-)